MSDRKGFLICPVRGAPIEDTEQLVSSLEEDGWSIHWPPRDTNQEDDTGYRICRDNREAIENAEVVFVVWDGKSQGCLFDLGMAFAMEKTIVPLRIPERSVGKSFQNMVAEWASSQQRVENNKSR